MLRLARVVAHIQQNLGSELRLEELARLAHVLRQADREDRVVHVTVVETRETRDDLIETILRETLGSQALLLVAVAVLVLLAVRRAVQPLQRLRGLMEAKADDDLRALPGGWPPELQPLVDAINGYTQRLGRLIGIRKRFLDNAAHQLRTPLTALKTQLGLMQRQSPAPEPALLQAAVRTTDDAVRLTAQLLALTRAEHGPDMDKTAEVDLVALARLRLSFEGVRAGGGNGMRPHGLIPPGSRRGDRRPRVRR